MEACLPLAEFDLPDAYKPDEMRSVLKNYAHSCTSSVRCRQRITAVMLERKFRLLYEET
jgi:hypothetical protein